MIHHPSSQQKTHEVPLNMSSQWQHQPWSRNSRPKRVIFYHPPSAVLTISTGIWHKIPGFYAIATRRYCVLSHVDTPLNAKQVQYISILDCRTNDNYYTIFDRRICNDNTVLCCCGSSPIRISRFAQYAYHQPREWHQLQKS